MTFSWMNFDPAFLKTILLSSEEFQNDAEDIRDEDDTIGLAAKMNFICSVPDKKFIMRYRTIIEQDLFKNYPEEVKKICTALSISGASFNIKQAAMTRKPMSAALIGAYISALYNISGLETEFNEYSRFKFTTALNMQNTEIEDVPLYDFQKDAVTALREHFLEKDNAAGMLVMPTGSGKSRTATYYLIKEMISRGYQILWIAHRHMLIDQAAECFYKFAGLSKIENPKIRDYRINCISGEHLSIKQVRDSEVIVASIASICRSKEHLRRILGRKVMVVVDEAHHTLAPTYQETIKFIRKCRRNFKLLGLTATPIRANEKDSSKLLGLFDNNIVYKVSMSDLIAKGILADPHCTRIETYEDFEPSISEDEAKLIQKNKELPESLVNKIASSHTRNQLILKEFLDNRDKYGKTLIFAMNVVHCRLLSEELTKHGIKCGHIYSGKEDNAKVIEAFKSNKLDVLVNVNIMTEGSDVPDIQTVFLTRPTQSEGLLMQMIGRGMRGKHAHGTETVNIVDFHDQWSTFNKWLNPEWLVCDEISEEETPEVREYKARLYSEYDWADCKEIYNSMHKRAVSYGKTISIPVAWYTLIDEEGELHRMLIFEDQMQGIIEMQKNKSEWADDLSITPKQIMSKYFSYFCTQPSLRDIELLMDNTRNCEVQPTIKIMQERKKIDPLYVTKTSEETGSDLFALAQEVYSSSDIVRDLYGSLENYQMEICKAKIYNGKNLIIGLKVEELPVELIPFDRTPVYDLSELADEVKDEMFGGTYDGIGTVSWTAKPYKGYYGIFYHESKCICINAVLNSKDVPREVVKFVIYHEMLHRDIHDHGKYFKELEHKYPRFEEWEAFLDSNMHSFDIKEW